MCKRKLYGGVWNACRIMESISNICCNLVKLYLFCV
jgi:hypothetical protein